MHTNDRVVRCMLALAAIALLEAGPARAACRWTYVEGRPMQNCDNPLDPPAANLSRLAPGVPASPPHVEIPAAPAARPGGCPPGIGQAGCR